VPGAYACSRSVRDGLETRSGRGCRPGLEQGADRLGARGRCPGPEAGAPAQPGGGPGPGQASVKLLADYLGVRSWASASMVAWWCGVLQPVSIRGTARCRIAHALALVSACALDGAGSGRGGGSGASSLQSEEPHIYAFGLCPPSLCPLNPTHFVIFRFCPFRPRQRCHDAC